MNLKTIFTLTIISLSAHSALTQDLDKLLEEATGSSTEYTIATFKSTRIVTGHSIERMPKNQLDFRISHRFGPVNQGAYQFWGLDQSTIRLALEYGITDWMMVGLGRNTYEKAFDGFLKFSILRQCHGEKNIPVSFSYLTSMSVNTLHWEKEGNLPFWYRVSYVHQLLIGRKFNKFFSLEINPTFIHNNLVPTGEDSNDIWALGIGGRVKLTRHISLNAEYYYVFPRAQNPEAQKTYPPLAIGFDIQTGGHVFQLHLTNSTGMIEKAFIGETTGSWLNGDIRFGFNISKVFTL